MNRDEFEKAYAEKYTNGDVLVVFANRDFLRYTDHHIDLCWKVQQLKNKSGCIHVIDIEW